MAKKCESKNDFKQKFKPTWKHYDKTHYMIMLETIHDYYSYGSGCCFMTSLLFVEVTRYILGLSARKRSRKGSARARGCHMGRGMSEEPLFLSHVCHICHVFTWLQPSGIWFTFFLTVFPFFSLCFTFFSLCFTFFITVFHLFFRLCTCFFSKLFALFTFVSLCSLLFTRALIFHIFLGVKQSLKIQLFLQNSWKE